MYVIKDSIAESRNDTAIPVKSSVSTATRPFLLDAKYTTIIERIAPAKANTGMNSPPKNTIEMAAPRAPPELVPRRYGSAIGFLKSPCMAHPAAASPAPTNTAAIILGRRTSNKRR